MHALQIQSACGQESRLTLGALVCAARLFGECLELLTPACMLAWREPFEREEVVRFGSALADKRALADSPPALADDPRSRFPSSGTGGTPHLSRSRPMHLRIAGSGRFFGARTALQLSGTRLENELLGAQLADGGSGT
jgi:hypothetical protein